MELSQLEARIRALNSEKKTATLNKAMGEASPEELERLARQLRAERKKATEAAARAELHSSFAEHPNEKVRESLKGISEWTKDELCALEEFKKDIADKRKKGGWMPARTLVPYDDEDEMPYTRAQLERQIADSQERGAMLMASIIEMMGELRVSGGVAMRELQAAARLASHAVEAEAETKKRKMHHLRRGCECFPEACGVAGTKGEKCKCVTSGIACDQRCMCHSSGKCVNPKNVAESAEEKEEREAWLEGRATYQQEQHEKSKRIAARAAAAAAAMDVDAPPKRG